jgi:hypothetical protein
VGEDVPIAVYPAMLAGTMAGHLLGIGLDVVALGTHSMWAPLGCSVLLEALIGARYGAARIGRPLTSGERGRLSVYYSLALVAVSVPLAVWLTASKHDRLPAVNVSSQDLLWVAAALAGLVVYTAVRYGLMAVFSPASSASRRAA